MILSLSRDLIAWGLGRRKLFRVKGRSMCPTLNDEDLVLVRYTHGKAPEIGSLVVARQPEYQIIIKRVRSRGDSAAYLSSDNPAEGTDSRHFGSVDFADIIGTVVRQF